MCGLLVVEVQDLFPPKNVTITKELIYLQDSIYSIIILGIIIYFGYVRKKNFNITIQYGFVILTIIISIIMIAVFIKEECLK